MLEVVQHQQRLLEGEGFHDLIQRGGRLRGRQAGGLPRRIGEPPPGGGVRGGGEPWTTAPPVRQPPCRSQRRAGLPTPARSRQRDEAVARSRGSIVGRGGRQQHFLQLRQFLLP